MSTDTPHEPKVNAHRYRLFRWFAVLGSVATLVEHADDPDHVLTIVLWSVIVGVVVGAALRDLREWWIAGRKGRTRV